MVSGKDAGFGFRHEKFGVEAEAKTEENWEIIFL